MVNAGAPRSGLGGRTAGRFFSEDGSRAAHFESRRGDARRPARLTPGHESSRARRTVCSDPPAGIYGGEAERRQGKFWKEVVVMVARRCAIHVLSCSPA